MSFRIYRLAGKKQAGGSANRGFAQIITTAGGLYRDGAAKRPLVIYSERRNSRRASFSPGLSFLNFSVTCAASPPWRRMASRSVTELPSCMRRECRRTPQSGAVRILSAVLLYSETERFLQLIWYMFLP